MYNIVKKEKKIRYIEKQKGDVNITHSDISKAKKILNFTPEVNIDAGLRNQYDWQKNYYK